MQPVTVTIPASSGLLISGSGYITYWSVLDTTVSSGSVFSLNDGADPAANALVTVSTDAGQSTSESIQRKNLWYLTGLNFVLTSGTISGSVTVHACDSPDEYQQLIAALGTLQSIAG